MDPVSGMLLGGAALGGLNSLLGVGASAADAALQYHYAKKMYQHRYRWAMSDMQKAGLNPVLAANGGNVSGMGSAPSTDFAGAVNSGVNSAMQTARTVSDLQAQQVTNAKTEADEKLAKANTQLAQGKKIEQDIRNRELPTTVRAQAFKAEAEASLANSASVIQHARTQYADALADHEKGIAFNKHTESAYKARSAAFEYGERRRAYYSQLPSDLERSLRYQEKLARIRSLNASPWFRGISSAAGLLKLLKK